MTRTMDATRSTTRRYGEAAVASPAQERLWFLEQFGHAGTAYGLPVTLRLEGPLDAEALEAGLGEVVRRHESLRTRFETAAGRPVPVVGDPAEFRLDRTDLSGLGPDEGAEQARRLVRENIERPFDLAAGPPFRARLVRIGPEEHLVLLNAHRIAADPRSVRVLIGELAALYAARVEGRPPSLPPPSQYADHASRQRAWLGGEEAARQASYWKTRLAGAPAALALPTDRPRPSVQGFRGAAVPFFLGADTSSRLAELARHERTTLEAVLLAAYALLLSRHGRQEDVIVGIPATGYPQSGPGGPVGPFETMLALRVDLSGGPGFPELLARADAALAGARAHADLPFETLIEALQPDRDPSRPPLVQSVFELETARERLPDLPGLRLSVEPAAHATTRFELSLSIRETADGLHGSFEYATDLFDRDTIGRLAGHYGKLLEGIAAEPARRADTIPLLTGAERDRLLVEWNDTATAYRQDRCLHELFSEHAAATPDAVAVVFEEQYLTYGELDRRSNRLAHHLSALGIGPDVVVGLCVERSLDMVVGVLGILKAGGAYLPLDPGYPRERLAHMLEDARTPVLVTHAGAIDPLPDRARVVRLDHDAEEIDRRPATALDGGATPANLAYVIYTSGSTGGPKGVMIPHAGIVNRLLWMDGTYRLGPSDRVLQKTPLSFDVSVWELLWPLVSGAATVLARPGGHLDPSHLASTIATREVTVTHFLPSMLRVLLDSGEFARCTGLREVLCGGETLPPDTVRMFLDRSAARLSNVYGPTEASIGMTCWHCAPRHDGSVPIGRPIGNMRAYVLDEGMEPVPIGVAGELYIGGVQLARGYLHRRGMTAQRFVPSPFGNGERLYRTGDLVSWLADGNLDFLGRLDHQVKVRGYRIELGEIEAAMTSHPGVEAAVAVVREDAAGEKRLTGYAATGAGAGTGRQAPTAGELRAHLRRNLPQYMVPTAIVVMDTLPLMPNGKLDRNALPAPSARQQTGDYVAPRDRNELTLQAIWERVLNVSPIGIKDDFFALGGHSLLAVELIGACNEAFSARLPLRALFDRPTIETFADGIRSGGGQSPYRALVPLQTSGTRAPVFCVHPAGGSAFRYVPLSRCLGTDQPMYGLQASGLEPDEPLAESVETMAACYVEAVRELRPRGPYRLLGWSFGGLVAYEMAHQLDRAGERVELLALLDTPLPRIFRDAPGLSPAEVVAALANQILGPPEPGDDRSGISTLTGLVETARARGLVSPDFTLAQAERMASVVENCIRIGRAYRPPRSSVDLVFFRATAQEGERRVPDALFDWSPLLAHAPLTIPVACTHLEMPAARFAEVVARGLQPRLERDEEYSR
ncbi:amino acid adenylation domain-containing protein [Arenibaculum sp.]|uniref:non-ribosomal peptide synthetase n=1 Tax=Arenibaculum sp. TaxID=2865862 RepID=UPI002E161463|nr:amino acid adenylation domain-containing protein [Arenibaculum sp.]